MPDEKKPACCGQSAARTRCLRGDGHKERDSKQRCCAGRDGSKHINAVACQHKGDCHQNGDDELGAQRYPVQPGEVLEFEVWVGLPAPIPFDVGMISFAYGATDNDLAIYQGCSTPANFTGWRKVAAQITIAPGQYSLAAVPWISQPHTGGAVAYFAEPVIRRLPASVANAANTAAAAVQAAANAEDTAKAYALALANAADVSSRAYVDGVIDAEEARAIADAADKAEAARVAAVAAAAADATAKANAAATTAIWDGVYGPGKPVNNATRNIVFYQDADPAGYAADGDIWHVQSIGKEYTRIGGAWVPTVGASSIQTADLAVDAVSVLLSSLLPAGGVGALPGATSTNVNSQITQLTWPNTTGAAVFLEAETGINNSTLSYNSFRPTGEAATRMYMRIIVGTSLTERTICTDWPDAANSYPSISRSDVAPVLVANGETVQVQLWIKLIHSAAARISYQSAYANLRIKKR